MTVSCALTKKAVDIRTPPAASHAGLNTTSLFFGIAAVPIEETDFLSLALDADRAFGSTAGGLLPVLNELPDRFDATAAPPLEATWSFPRGGS